MDARELLIVGATGQQGKATIAALTASIRDSTPIRILALTRSITSPKALALQEAYPTINLVEGDFHDPGRILTANPNISAIFIVTVPPDEEAQALPLIDAAMGPGNRVDHLVFSSVDRGGDVVSWENPTAVPHFAAKHRIELHLRDACEKANKRWTILRPTGFMDNYNPGFFGKLMASLWGVGLPPNRKMQLVSTRDIGVFAAKALLDPDKWAGRAVGLAGDEISFSEAQEIFQRILGQEMPQTYSIVGRAVTWWVEEARTSFEWFNSVGYNADIAMLKREEPGLQNFEKWLREESRWVQRE